MRDRFRKMKRTVWLILLIGWMGSVGAQSSVNVEAFNTSDGLSQGMIYDILQDRDGFLWIATQAGLNRYDGYTFKVYTNDPNDPYSIASNTVEKLFEDRAGRIWAACDRAGLSILDKTTGRFHHLDYDPNRPDGLTGSNIDYFVEDTSGYFVVSIDEQELNMFRLDGAFFEQGEEPEIIRIQAPARRAIQPNQEYIKTQIKGLAQDGQHRIWVGLQDAIYQLNVKKAALTLAQEGYSIGTNVTVPDGSVWACGSNYSLFHWKEAVATPFPKRMTGGVGMELDEAENLWILNGEGLSKFPIAHWITDGSFSVQQDPLFFEWLPPSAARDLSFRSFEMDQSRALWMGTAGYGIYKVNPQQLAFEHHLAGISVRMIVPADSLPFLAADFNHQWYDLEGNMSRSGPLSQDDIYVRDYLFTDRAGHYWGRRFRFEEPLEFLLLRYDPITQDTQQYPIDSYHMEIQPMLEGQDGRIYLAGYSDRFAVLDPETGAFLSYDLVSGTRRPTAPMRGRLRSEDLSTALYQDVQGTIWVGSERGFTKVELPAIQEDALTVTHYKNEERNPNSLSYEHVSCFLDDPLAPDRYLWIATKGGGINRLDKQSGDFLRLSTREGLPNPVVYGLLDDEAGNLWGSTNKGLFCMQREGRSGANEAYTFLHFSKKDGLQENEFNTGAYAKLPDGRLAFGGINGVNIFDPKEVIQNDFHPKTFLTNIWVNNEEVRVGDETDILAQSIEYIPQITLNHLQDILTLEFSTLDFRDPESIRYRYQLVGLDDQWIEAGNRRSATFLHLPADTYTFRVQGTNSRGVWSEHVASLKIVVLPPWWKTWWAYTTYLLVTVLALGLFLQLRINRAKLKQQLSFEKQEAQRVRELDALKSRLFTNMTHEFRTPLTIIIGMAQQVLEHPKDHWRNGLQMIQDNGKHLLGLVNKMLDLAKLESGKMQLNAIQGDVIPFLRNTIESHRSYTANKDIQLHILPEVDQLVMDYDPEKLQQVVSNLLSNAFKFTPPNGQIYCSIRAREEVLYLRIKDTGKGIAPAHQAKIFDRFYQADNTDTRAHEGTGIGLALCQELVHLMNGHISVQSPPVGAKKGTEFTVVLPIQNSAIPVEAIQSTPVIQMTDWIEEQPSQEETQSQTTGLTPSAPPPPITESEESFILLVEDNEDLLAYIQSCLSEYQVLTAKNGQEGLELATIHIPDLIISDVMMPIMDGFQLCQSLKTDPRTDHIPVILLTARADIESKMEGLQLGANAYLPKPFEKQELLLNIKNLFTYRDTLRARYQDQPVPESDTSTAEAPPEDPFVIEVRTIIEAHLSDFDFTVEQLAKAIHLSPSQCTRKLNALTGYTPSRFIRHLRIEQAKKLLQDEKLSITAVAFDCGFSDPGYFSRVFKKETGVTPGGWREE